MRLDRYEARELFWLLLYALALIGLGIGSREPWPADEPRFVLVARQMLESGEWLFPQRGQELYADKPPLYFWLLALAHALTGGWRGSFLLPSLLASLGTVALTWDLARRLWGRQAARHAAGALLLCAHFVFHARRAQIDPTLVFLTSLSLYGLLRHLLLGPHWRWYVLGAFAAGLGVITKGVGFLPLAVLLPYFAMRRAGWSGLAPIPPGQAARWWLGAAAFVAAIALWLGPLLAAVALDPSPGHRAYLNEILFRQTLERYAQAWVHRQPPWYYLEVVAVSWLPFSLALPWLIRSWGSAWRQVDARVWLPLAWAGLVLAFFTLSSGKRDVYILPALPALALAAAPWLSVVLDGDWPRRLLRGLYAALALALLAVGVWALVGDPEFAGRILHGRGLDADDSRPWWLLVAIGAAMATLLLVLGRRCWLAGVLGAHLALFGGYGLGVYPLLDADSSARAVMQRARAAAGPDIVLGLVGWREQNLLQVVGPVAEFGFSAAPEEQWARAAAWIRVDPASRMLFVQDGFGAPCLEMGSTVPLGVANRRAWRLVPAEALCGPE